MMILVGLVAALFFGTLVEYLLHRAMHEWGFFTARHWYHHKVNHAHDWLWDAFCYYLPLSTPLLLIGLLGGFYFFVGWCVGDLVFCFILSACHYIQHHHPRKVFWMRYPIHKLHHRCRKADRCYNYGIVTCWWDHVFGTYHVPKVTNARQ
jgi:sterol desaturase/sphingolipid hydroxylase (fatty acid hydroxylase superfamily)